MTETEVVRELMKRVNRMNLFIIDDEYKAKHFVTYGEELDDKYVYRNFTGDHVYSIEYLINNRSEAEISYDDELPSHSKGSE